MLEEFRIKKEKELFENNNLKNEEISKINMKY